MTTSVATFGSGCFWCTAAIFKDLKGVTRVTSGYAGGLTPNPTYEQVSAHRTGHAEVVQVEFDPDIITYDQLVEVFFLTHDPTTMNRQGHDVGEQYRSIIFYHDDSQRQTALNVKTRVEQQQVYGSPIVTEVTEFKNFYAAEDYHQDYYAKNPNQAYCQVVIDPKVAQFRKKFSQLLK